MSKLHLGVAHDHIIAQTKFRKPIVAIEELIWNSLDADATRVEIRLKYNRLQGLDQICVIDNGHGIPHSNCENAFGSIGGSPKLNIKETPHGRRPHGKSGRGRLKAFGLGRAVSWQSVTCNGSSWQQFTMTGYKSTIETIDVSEPCATEEREPGVTVTISDLETNSPDLTDAIKAVDSLSQRFALYLKKYPGIEIRYDGYTLDPASAQQHEEAYPLSIEMPDGSIHVAELTVIEWRRTTERAIYLCDRDGFARHECLPAIHAKGWHFTAYLKSEIIEELEEGGSLALEELHPGLKAVLDTARDTLRSHFRKRESSRATDLVKRWREEKVYPYSSFTESPVEEAKREVFDICALTVNEYLPDFENQSRENKLLTFRLIKQGLETSPSALQKILSEVLALPPERQADFARLLDRTTLSAIINAARIVVDRLAFLECLRELVFGSFKLTLNEPHQLHRILADELWLFGEQYLMGADERSLTNVLKRHLDILERDELVTPVKDLNNQDRFLDLMLYKRAPQPIPNKFDHLVIELKRPSLVLGQKEIGQIQKYAFIIGANEQFDKRNVKWTFMLIGNQLDDFATKVCQSSDREPGHIHTGEVEIWVKTWSEIIDNAKWRYEFFRQQLELTIGDDDVAHCLKQKHAQWFKPGEIENTLHPPTTLPMRGPTKQKSKGRRARDARP